MTVVWQSLCHCLASCLWGSLYVVHLNAAMLDCVVSLKLSFLDEDLLVIWHII